MKKHVMGLFAAVLLIGVFTSVPAVSAASSAAQPNDELSAPSIGQNSNGEDNQSISPGSSNEGTDTTEETTNGNTDNGNTDNGNTDNGNTDNGNQQNSDSIEKVIADGLKYKGTPYEFGSNRSTAETFDCSDFVKWIFKESLSINLPADSRQQGAYVKNNGTAETDWHNLKRGDLMFFMSYKGSNEANYQKIDKETQRITHVGIYLGDGKILHTYSNASGGVHVGNFADTAWEHRFLFGGSALKKS